MGFEQLPSDSKGLLKKPEYIPILDHAASVINAVRGLTHEMDRFAIHSALDASTQIATRCNTLIERTSPWQLAKQKESSQQLDAVLYHLGRIASHHRDFDFAGVAESSAWNFRSTELEDGVERKRRTVLTRRCGVGEIAGWTCGRQASAVVPADRILIAGTA